MKLFDLKNKLKRPATAYQTGGFRPSGLLDESWIGRVVAFREDEGLPVDANESLMIPLAQFALGSLFVPCKELKDIQLITVFVSSSKLPEPFERMGAHFCIREYRELADLVPKHLETPMSQLKQFPLKAKLIEEDYPVWDDGQMSIELMDAVLRLEENGEIDSYYDFATHCNEHKFGGYPSYCQSGKPFSDGFEFVFQISSDPKANLDFVHGGSMMFAKNTALQEWEVYYDFM